MTTRRNALMLLGAVPAGSWLWTLTSQPKANTATTKRMAAFTPDRELHLKLSDAMKQQKWIYAGQHYTEERDTILVDEGELLQLFVVNDMIAPQSLVVDNVRVELAVGMTATMELQIDGLQTRTLINASCGAKRPLRVRPTYQSHAAFLA